MLVTKCLTALLIIAICQVVDSLIKFPGKCPKIKPQRSISLEWFMGMWYLQTFFPFDDEPQLDCEHYFYLERNDRYYEFELMLNRSFGEKIVHIRSSVLRLNKKKRGIDVKRRHSSYDSPPHDKPIPVRPDRYTMHFLGLAYDSYASMYTCINVEGGHYMGAWVLTRNCRPSTSTISIAQDYFANASIDLQHMRDARQYNCENVPNP